MHDYRQIEELEDFRIYESEAEYWEEYNQSRNKAVKPAKSKVFG